MEELSFDVHGPLQLVAMSWSDNRFTFANNTKAACKMMNTWGTVLEDTCGLRLKPESRKVEPSLVTYGGLQWKVVSTLQTLGQCISCAGSQIEDRKRVRSSGKLRFGAMPRC